MPRPVDLWADLPAEERKTRRGKRWEVRWRDASGRSQRERFTYQSQAERHCAKLILSPGDVISAEGRALTVDTMMDTWLATKAGLKGLKTQDNYETDRREVLTTFAGKLARAVKHSEVLVWVARARGDSLKRRSLTALRAAYAIAIRDHLVDEDPTAEVKVPRGLRKERHYLTGLELGNLAVHAGPRDAPLVWLLGTVGLRLGEAVAIKVGDVNHEAKKIYIRRQVTEAKGGAKGGPPKGGKSREVPVPKFVLDMLPTKGRADDEWLFVGVQGGRLNAASWRRQNFKPAAVRAGLGDLDPHEMRHTAASLAIANGAHVGVVQRMLGHASPSITLNLYSHLFDASLDDIANRMDEALRQYAPRAA